MRSIRSGRGFGDSIYLQSIARHLIERGESLHVLSDYPDLFRDLPVQVSPHNRRADLVAHYVARKGTSGTSQFTDMCLSVGIRERIPLELRWSTDISSHPLPMVCVQLPRSPMGRTDGFGADILPDCRAIQTAINHIRGRAKIVQIGAGTALFKFDGIDTDLSNKTTIVELLNIACHADAFLGYPSFIIPLAEAMNKPALIVWSSRGLKSRDPFISRITPAKLLHKDTSYHVADNCEADAINDSIDMVLRCKQSAEVV